MCRGCSTMGAEILFKFLFYEKKKFRCENNNKKNTIGKSFSFICAEHKPKMTQMDVNHSDAKCSQKNENKRQKNSPYLPHPKHLSASLTFT